MNWLQPKTYAVKHKDESVRWNSRSGGIFTALSDWIIENNGVVYGCVLTKDFQATHIRAENKADRDLMHGSKYIQSKLGDIFKSVKQDLNLQCVVLFSGTPCQVAGLKKFLAKDYDNLICVDILCHGVPSPAVWSKYLQWQEEKNHSKAVSVNFRDKTKYGWRDHVETLLFENNIEVDSRVFSKLFYTHNILRPSCYTCPYKATKREGDISIADYWKIEIAAPEFDDNKGVSLVLINNDKGMILFQKVKNTLKWKETRLEDSMQNALMKSYDRPATRDKFWVEFNKEPFDKVVKKYGSESRIKKLKKKIKNFGVSCFD